MWIEGRVYDPNRKFEDGLIYCSPEEYFGYDTRDEEDEEELF